MELYMIEIDIPGARQLRLRSLVLDLNGTLSLDGRLLPTVAGRMNEIRSRLDVYLLSADTFGTAAMVAEELGVRYVPLRVEEVAGPQKARFVGELGRAGVAAIGNGTNDVEMLQEAALGICVLGREGLATRALTAADIVTGSVYDALDLLLNTKRLVATLRP